MVAAEGAEARSMRVAIEAAPLSLSSGGLLRYTTELSLALARCFTGDEFFLVSDQPFDMPRDAEILREEFLSPLGMSAHELALALRVPATRINDIVNEKRGITADTALRLSRYFGTTPRFWMNMQASWELEVAEDQLGYAVRCEALPRSA